MLCAPPRACRLRTASSSGAERSPRASGRRPSGARTKAAKKRVFNGSVTALLTALSPTPTHLVHEDCEEEQQQHQQRRGRLLPAQLGLRQEPALRVAGDRVDARAPDELCTHWLHLQRLGSRSVPARVRARVRRAQVPPAERTGRAQGVAKYVRHTWPNGSPTEPNGALAAL